MLPDDDIAESAVTVEGDREDRDLGSLHFFVAVHCSSAKDDGFQWPDTSEILLPAKFLSRREYKGTYTVM